MPESRHGVASQISSRRPFILLAVLLLASCGTTGVVLPYVARVQSVEPEIPGLSIRATAGGGGELEIKNHSSQAVVLLDAQGSPYVKITPDGVLERIGQTWTKTANTPVYYCHDPRIAYQGPEPDYGNRQVLNDWEISGLAGTQTFVVRGQTVYAPSELPQRPLVLGLAILLAIGLLAVCVVGVFLFLFTSRS